MSRRVSVVSRARWLAKWLRVTDPRSERFSRRTAAIIDREQGDWMKRKLTLAKSTSPTPTKPGAKGLLADVRELILATRQTVARGVNSALVLLYWNIGQRIRADILKEKRASYGEKIFYALSRKLTAEFGNGFSQANLFHMARFAEAFPDVKIVHALSAQLSWTHLRRIIYLDDPLKRDFYAEICRIERWNTRTLHEKIQSLLFERTALSKKPAKLMALELKKLREEDKLTPDLVFRDPYLLDFLRLKDTYAESEQKVLPKRRLERKLHEAVRLARARLQTTKDDLSGT